MEHDTKSSDDSKREFCIGNGRALDRFCLQQPKYVIDGEAYCTIHAKQENRRRKFVGKPEVSLTQHKQTKTPRPKFETFIDETVTNPNQCCIRIRPNQPSCAQNVVFKIRDHYFCRSHGQKHPEAKDAIILKPKTQEPPPFEDLIDTKLTDPTRCCMCRSRDGPHCYKPVVYRIHGKYFCGEHGGKHPNGGDAIMMPTTEHGRHALVLSNMNERLTSIETVVRKMATQWDYLLGFKEFRDVFYNISEKGVHGIQSL